MIKENQGLLNKIHVVLDAVVIVISYVLSWYLRFRSGIFEMDPWYLSLQVYMSVLIFIIPGYLLLYYIFQLYTPKRVRGRRLEAWNILQANTIGFLVFILVLYFRHQTDFSRTMIFVFELMEWILFTKYFVYSMRTAGKRFMIPEPIGET